MVAKLTTEEEDALALQDAFAEQQYTRGVFAGGAADLAGKGLDFLNRISQANLAGAVARDTISRGKRLSQAAGKGAADRLATARGQKLAFARGAAKQAATMATMDPTGASAVQFSRDINRITQDAGDMSKETTLEMQQAIKEKALAEQIRSKGEQQQLISDQQKSAARFQGVKDLLYGAAGVAQALKPQTFKAKQQSIAKRQEIKQDRLGKRGAKLGEKLTAKTEGIQTAVEEGKLTPQEASADLQGIQARAGKFQKKVAKSQAKQQDAAQNLMDINEAERKKLLRRYGNVLSNPITPTADTTAQ